jgi:electron transfer flavoprotein beta subunit
MRAASLNTGDIVALVSTRIDAVSQRATRHPLDAVAAATALQLDPSAALLTAGDMPETVARAYLGLGAQALTVLTADAPAAVPIDALALLTPALASSRLVLCGARSEGALGSGLLPYQLAHALSRPLIADVIEVTTDGAGWRVRQALPRGARRDWRVTGPAVLVMSERLNAPQRHSHQAAQQGRIQHQRVSLGAVVDAAVMTFEPSRKQLRPLAPRNTQGGHARMAQATGGAPTTQATVLLREGSVHDKAQALLNHLRAQALIDF